MKNILKSEDSRILLRDIESKDAEFLMELNNDKEISHFVVGNPRTVTLQEQLQWMENIKNEKNCKRFIVEVDGLAVGTVIVSNIDTVNGTAGIGIKLNNAVQGRGIGKKSINLVMKYCFEVLNLACLTAHILEYNKASQALFRSCGFVEEGRLRSRVVKENKRYDLFIFSKLKSEY